MNLGEIVKSVVSGLNKGVEAVPSGFKTSEGLLTGGLVAVAVTRAPDIFTAISQARGEALWPTVIAGAAEVALYVGLGFVLAYYSLNRTRLKVAEVQAEVEKEPINIVGAPPVLSQGDEDDVVGFGGK